MISNPGPGLRTPPSALAPLIVAGNSIIIIGINDPANSHWNASMYYINSTGDSVRIPKQTLCGVLINVLSIVLRRIGRYIGFYKKSWIL